MAAAMVLMLSAQASGALLVAATNGQALAGLRWLALPLWLVLFAWGGYLMVRSPAQSEARPMRS